MPTVDENSRCFEIWGIYDAKEMQFDIYNQICKINLCATTLEYIVIKYTVYIVIILVRGLHANCTIIELQSFVIHNSGPIPMLEYYF